MEMYMISRLSSRYTSVNKIAGPEIEGLHDFAGPKMHSATWDESVDFKDKTVASE